MKTITRLNPRNKTADNKPYVRIDTWTHKCGHVDIQESWVYHDMGYTEHHTLGKMCYACRVALIGQRADVVIYGDIPKSGYSHNYADNRSEAGVSCYFQGDRPRPEFSERKKIALSAIVIGYGSDDEPIIDASTIIILKK